MLGDGRRVVEADATYLPPCDPTKILCVHLNYPSRAIEFGVAMGATPTYFQKPTTAMNSHRGLLLRPADCQYLNYEGEIAAIIGKPMRNIAPDDTWSYLAGFAPANDVGCHDYRDTDAGGMLRVKGMDGFCPVGPGIVRGVDIRQSTVRTYINGHVVQEDPVDGDDLRDRLHARRPVPSHHPAPRRHRAHRDTRQLAPDGTRRRRRGRGHRRRTARPTPSPRSPHPSTLSATSRPTRARFAVSHSAPPR